MAYCEINGLEEVISALEKNVFDAHRQINKILKDAGQMFCEEMKSNVPVSSINHKHLKDSIAVSNVKEDELGGKYVTVGTNLNNGRYRNNVYWGHFVEGGHAIVVNGKNKGFVEGKPFIQPAYNKIKDKAYKFVSSEIYKALKI